MSLILPRTVSSESKSSNGSRKGSQDRRLFDNSCINAVYVTPSNCFLSLGYSIYDHPYLYGFIPLLFVGLLCLGNLRIERNTDTMDMLSLGHGQVRHAKEVLDANFPPQRVTHIVATWNPYANLTSSASEPTTTAIQEDGVFTREFFQEVATFFQFIKDIELPKALLNHSDVPGDTSVDRWIHQNVHYQSSKLLTQRSRTPADFFHTRNRDAITLEDVCVRSARTDDCEILNPLTLYTHPKEWGTPIIAAAYPNFYSKVLNNIVRLDTLLGGMQIARSLADRATDSLLPKPQNFGVEQTSPDSLWGEPLDPQTATGAVVVHNASAVAFRILLRGDTPELKRQSALWEAGLIALSHSALDSNIKLNILTERSCNDELYNTLTLNRKDLPFYIVSGTLLVTLVFIMNSSSSWRRTKTWSALAGLFLTLWAVAGGRGFWFILGNKHFPVVDSAGFLVFLLSVNIIFIFIHTFCAMLPYASNPRERTGRTLQKIGTSLTISCLGGLSVFIAGGAITDIGGVRAFYSTVAICLSYLYLLSFTTLVAVLSWEARREPVIKGPIFQKNDVSQNIQSLDDCNDKKIIAVTQMYENPQQTQLASEEIKVETINFNVNGPPHGAAEADLDLASCSSPCLSCVALDTNTPLIQETTNAPLASDEGKRRQVIENQLSSFLPSDETSFADPAEVTVEEPDALYSSKSLRIQKQEPKGTVGHLSRRFFHTFYAPIIVHSIVQVLVLFGFWVSWTALGYFALQLKAGTAFTETLPSNSYITSFLNVRKKNFPTLGEECTIIIPDAGAIPWWEPKIQDALFQMTQTLAVHNHSVLMLNGLTSFLSYQYGIGPNIPDDPRDDTWRQRSSYENDTVMGLLMSLKISNHNTIPPNSAKPFYSALRAWLEGLQGAFYRPMFVFDKKTGMLASWKFQYWLLFSVNTSEEALLKLETEFQAIEKAKPYFTALLHTPLIGYWEVEKTTVSVTLVSAAIAIAILSVLAFLLIPDILCAAVAVFTIIMIEVCVLGTMVILQIRLNCSSMAILIFSTCFVVDYTVHFTSCFSRTAGRSSSERLRDALLIIGPPMTKGLVCVFCTTIGFGLTRNNNLLTIFKVLTIVLLWASLHGLVFIPVVLFFVGGSNHA